MNIKIVYFTKQIGILNRMDRVSGTKRNLVLKKNGDLLIDDTIIIPYHMIESIVIEQTETK